MPAQPWTGRRVRRCLVLVAMAMLVPPVTVGVALAFRYETSAREWLGLMGLIRPVSFMRFVPIFPFERQANRAAWAKDLRSKFDTPTGR